MFDQYLKRYRQLSSSKNVNSNNDGTIVNTLMPSAYFDDSFLLKQTSRQTLLVCLSMYDLFCRNLALTG